MNRLDSNLLDDPRRIAGPTVAAVTAISGSDAGPGRSGGGSDPEAEAPVGRGSRFRVLS